MGIIIGSQYSPDSYFMIEHVWFKYPRPQLYFFILEGDQMIPLSHVARECDFLGESSRLAAAPVTTYCLANDQFHPKRSVEELLHQESE